MHRARVPADSDLAEKAGKAADMAIFGRESSMMISGAISSRTNSGTNSAEEISTKVNSKAGSIRADPAKAAASYVLTADATTSNGGSTRWLAGTRRSFGGSNVFR
mgnify:CR=1 FL=1